MKAVVLHIARNIWKGVFLRRKNEYRVWRKISQYLRRGIYYFPYNSNVIQSIDYNTLKWRNISHIYVNLHDYGKCVYAEYGIGCGKVVYLSEKTAYGFYDTTRGYSNSKRNYDKNYEQFNYPCVQNISFDDELQCIKMDRVLGGKVYNDYSHDCVIIKKMIEQLENSDRMVAESGEVLFLQHGDANRVNVLWTEENEFCFIDLDNIGYYPPFLDVFHYLALAKYDINDIIEMLMENREGVLRICRRAQIDRTDNWIDTLFYFYVKHYVNMGICYEDFDFLTVDNTRELPKTNSLLRNIFKGERRNGNMV